MYQVYVRFPILTDDFEAAAQATNTLLDILADLDSVQSADVGVSMTEGLLEVWLVVPASDPLTAVGTAAHALSFAFFEAGIINIGEAARLRVESWNIN